MPLTALCIIFVMSGIWSCSPKVITQTRTEYVYQDRVQRDSIYLRDSICVTEKAKGDTVYIEKNILKYIYKDKIRKDTVRIEKHDTTTITKEVKVEKPLSRAQRAKQDAFWWLVLAVAGLGTWTFRKQILRLI